MNGNAVKPWQKHVFTQFVTVVPQTVGNTAQTNFHFPCLGKETTSCGDRFDAALFMSFRKRNGKGVITKQLLISDE
jgi:hypothetical protein